MRQHKQSQRSAGYPEGLTQMWECVCRQHGTWNTTSALLRCTRSVYCRKKPSRLKENRATVGGPVSMQSTGEHKQNRARGRIFSVGFFGEPSHPALLTRLLKAMVDTKEGCEDGWMGARETEGESGSRVERDSWSEKLWVGGCQGRQFVGLSLRRSPRGYPGTEEICYGIASE